MTNSGKTSGGFLVVRRINWQTDIPVDNPEFLPNLRPPTIHLSHEGVRNRYRGFDGWPWPGRPHMQTPSSIGGLALPETLTLVEQYYEEVSKLYVCDLIYVDFAEHSSRNLYLPAGFVLLGYDFGYYVSEYNYFSSLLHEVIYGIYESMTKYAETLNGRLLLPNIEAARTLHATRTRLLETDADLERDGEVLTPVAIFGSEHSNYGTFETA
jgi:hypothetical protein